MGERSTVGEVQRGRGKFRTQKERREGNGSRTTQSFRKRNEKLRSALLKNKTAAKNSERKDTLFAQSRVTGDVSQVLPKRASRRGGEYQGGENVYRKEKGGKRRRKGKLNPTEGEGRTVQKIGRMKRDKSRKGEDRRGS